jgi:hypothetical protein
MKRLLFPSSGGGVDATSRKYRRRHPLKGTDGVVTHISDHPVSSGGGEYQHAWSTSLLLGNKPKARDVLDPNGSYKFLKIWTTSARNAS